MSPVRPRRKIPANSGERALPPALLFGREWVRAPLRVGAVAPSSTALAAAMTRGVNARCSPVIELGPGTGVFTRALLSAGVPTDRLVAIEASDRFATALRTDLPDTSILTGDAARVRHLSPFGAGKAGLVICGLPLLSMPPAKVTRIVAGSFATLRPDGVFRLFTYGRRCPVPRPILERLGIKAERVAAVPRNMPPAWVFDLTRAPRN